MATTQPASIPPLATHDLGGSGPVIVMVHGAGFHGHVWRQTASLLAPHFRVLAVDLPGHGRSPSPARPLSWSTLANLLQASISELSMPVAIAGHSVGATLALLVADREPSNVRALWLYEPIVFADDEAAAIAAERLARRSETRRSKFVDQADALAHFTSRPPFDSFDPKVLADYVSFGTSLNQDGESWRLACAPSDEAATYRGIDRHGYAWLGDVECPVKVVTGDEPHGPAPLSSPIEAALADARIETWGEADHFGVLADPYRTARSIAAHLEVEL